VLLQLVDILRCPADHEESALVLSADAWQDGLLRSGRLGCPVCLRQYPIRGRQVDFTGPESASPEAQPVGHRDPNQALRLAAQLALMGPGGFVLLEGSHAAHAAALAALSEVVVLVVGFQSEVPEGAFGLRVASRLPLASGSVRGVAVAAPAIPLDELVRVVQPQGRLVLPTTATPPEGAEIVAQDDRDMVLTVRGIPQVLQLRRGLRT
jgi:uncharacterized protein YbaR (Trm112 family)